MIVILYITVGNRAVRAYASIKAARPDRWKLPTFGDLPCLLAI
jgi:hypothetical protein